MSTGIGTQPQDVDWLGRGGNMKLSFHWQQNGRIIADLFTKNVWGGFNFQYRIPEENMYIELYNPMFILRGEHQVVYNVSHLSNSQKQDILSSIASRNIVIENTLFNTGRLHIGALY